VYDSGCGDGETERQRILLFFGGISDDDFGYKTFLEHGVGENS